MPKIIKKIIIINIICVAIFILSFFCLRYIDNKSSILFNKRHNLVNQYMIDNNLPNYNNVFFDYDNKWINLYIDKQESLNEQKNKQKKINKYDRLFLDFKKREERTKKIKLYREQLRIQYKNIDNQIYKEEQKTIDNLQKISYILENCLLIIFWLFCISISFVVLYFLITKTPIKKIDIKNNLNQIIPIMVSIIFLSLAIFEIDIAEEAAFYSLLRIIVSATLFYISLILKDSKSVLFWLSLSLGILFNPIVPIHLDDSNLWKYIDIFTITYLFIYTIIKLKKRESK